MKTPRIRKLSITIEESHTEMGKSIDPPRRKLAIGAIVDNPFAGSYVEDLEELYDLGASISGYLTTRGVEVLDVEPNDITGYGKAAIVGTNGEIEHAAALLHPRFGAPVRAAVDHGNDIITSTKMVAGPGSKITVPLTNKDAIWEFDDMDAIEFGMPDGPRPDEFVIIISLSIDGRPLARTKKDA